MGAIANVATATQPAPVIQLLKRVRDLQAAYPKVVTPAWLATQIGYSESGVRKFLGEAYRSAHLLSM